MEIDLIVLTETCRIYAFSDAFNSVVRETLVTTELLKTVLLR